jgi:RimJ/RimL family protein N-acetyltransferase
MHWITHPLRLYGKLVRVEPLVEAHIPDLVAAGSDPAIWTHLPFDGSDSKRLSRELGAAILNRIHGSQYPFTIFRQSDDRIIGSTRFFDIFPEHKKLEIGWTWYAPDVWGKGYNIDCKLLLLGHCFETLGANRVQLKTRTGNARSRAAIEKIGGVFEGLLRNDRVMPDGSVKDTVIFSVIKEEWPELKARLEEAVGELAT